MNLLQIDGEFSKFREKIIKSLKLQYNQEDVLVKQRNLSNWITAEESKMKKAKEDPKGIFHREFIMGMVQKIVKAQESKDVLENDLKILSQFIRKKMIPKTFSFESKGIPSEILLLVNQLKQKKWADHYGEVRGPLLKNMFIMKKEDFHSNVEQVKVNGLKFLMIQQKVAHLYQRNLVQELFGRIFRSKGNLSMVIKIQVNHDPFEAPYNLFCYIEDRQVIDEDYSCKSLNDLKIDSNQLYLQKDGINLPVNSLNVLQIFLSEIMVLPVQSLVSDYIIRVQKQRNSEKQWIQIIKCNQQDQEEIVQEKSLKQHPSLRNSFLYFSSYIRQHSIQVSQAQKVAVNTQLYASFYRCLQIIMKLMLTDFDTNFDDTKINSSLCFNAEAFRSLWTVFHKISLISAWMNEVILPVKKTITISEIINHFCPIFNQISNSNTTAQSYGAYRDFYHNVEMESYLGSIVSKKSLQKYKDIFLNESQLISTRKFTNSIEIYNQIFNPILRQVNLQYINGIEASYILYFACKFKYQYHPLPSDIQAKWKELAIWQRCIRKLKEKKNQSLPFIDIGFDILGFSCGFNLFSYDPQCFERVRNLEQSEISSSGISWFVDFIRETYELSSQPILSSLLQKSFKYKKFKTCKRLLEKGIRIRNFKQIIGFHQIINQMDLDFRQQLSKTIQEDSPQMHRLFKWQQLIFVSLQKETKETVPIQTLDFGTLHIPQIVLQTHIKNGKVINNLSRKDQKFNSNREISLVQYKSLNGKQVSFYIEGSQYPLMPYYYKAFLSEIGSSQMMPYFTSFFYENKLFHIIECLSSSLNYQNGLSTMKEDQLNSLTNETLISEAIIMSIILPTQQIGTRDITICPSKAVRDQIFIVDWHRPYSKDFMHKYLGKVHMNSKNSIFLLQKMTKAIDKKTITKFAGLQIEKLCENILFQCKRINDKVNDLKTKHVNQDFHSSSSQLLALLFEQGFSFMIVERMHKIKRMFSKKQGLYEKGLSFYRLLEIINSQVSYYYQQIFNYHTHILDREKVMFDQDWKRPFSHISLVEFFGSFSRLEEKDSIFPLHYQKFCFEGPTENNVYVASHMNKLLAFRTQIPQNIAEYENDTFEYYMKNCDLTELQMSKKVELAEIIKSMSRRYLQEKEKRVLPLSYICIKSMQFVKDKKIGSDISFERVEQLLIESCRLSQYQLNYFPRTIENILYLQLRDITGLRYIGDNTLYGKSIEIKHLKTLTIIECHELISIDLKCDILENLELRNNKSLEIINVYSLNLKNIYVFNNPNVNFENIGIYIIKGINVLICKSSCRGDFMKVYSEDYETYVSYVLKFLMLKFFESGDSRYWIMLTLKKMKEVEESLFTYGGITNIKGVSTIFKNFSAQFEDRAITQLLRVYISNIHHRKVSIGDLVQSGSMITASSLNIERLFRLINEALTRSNSAKKTTEIKFENTKFFFTNSNCSNIKTMIDRLNLDKNLTFVLENLKQQAEGDDNQSKMIVDREIQTLRYISIQKPQIDKLNLVFRKSVVKYCFMDRIFHGTHSLESLIRQEESAGSSSKSRSGIRSRLSLKDTTQNYIKIHYLHLDSCTIINDRLIDLGTLENQLKVVQSKLSSEIDVLNPSEIDIQDICKPNCHFGSVRYLKLENCILDSFQIIQSMPHLISLAIYKCQPKSNLINLSSSRKSWQSNENDMKLILAVYDRLFRILKKTELQILDLQNFFTPSNSVGEQQEIFHNLCGAVEKMKRLKKLKLNKNYLSLTNLKKLDEILNKTTIQELELNQISFPLDKLSTENNQIDKQVKSHLQMFENLFKYSRNLKSLSIQLNSKQVIEAFITSISKNQSLIELKLNTACELPSKILEPLNKNNTLNFVSSNMKLPVWLLKHVIENEKKGKKMMRQKYSEEEDQQATRQFEVMNTTLSLGSMNSLKSGADFYKLGLSLDGGGVRGMLLATQLNYLATRVGYPLHKIFDCIGGTSIGGILALASTSTLDGENPVASSEELMNIFSKYGKDIFKKTQIMQLKNLFDTKYSAASFEGVLKNYFKDSKLSNCLSDTNVIITAVNRVDNKDYIFRSSQALLNRDRDFYVRDVARATSAAPTYFPSAQIKNVNASLKLSLVDGGVGMNNPSKLVIDQVKKMSTNAGLSDNYFLLSLGTGKLPNQVIPQFAGIKDIAPIIDSFTVSTAYFVERDLATNYKGHFLRVSPLIDVKVKKDAELDNTSEPIIEMYRQTGLEAAKKYFENTVIFGKYRNMNLIEWLRENTVRKLEY